MSESDDAVENQKINFKIYQDGRKVEGEIIGHSLPQNTHFLVNFQDAESVFVEASSLEFDGKYQFTWATEGMHRYSRLFSFLNELILKHYTSQVKEDEVAREWN